MGGTLLNVSLKCVIARGADRLSHLHGAEVWIFASTIGGVTHTIEYAGVSLYLDVVVVCLNANIG